MKDVVSSCPIEEAMQVLSGRWPTLLLYYLKDGTKRFSKLRRDNPTVSHRILSLELRKLQEAGVVRRTAHKGYPLRVDYSLTPFGLQLVPLIDSVGEWWEGRPSERGSEFPQSLSIAEADRPATAQIQRRGGGTAGVPS